MRIALLVLVIVAALGLAACGSKGVPGVAAIVKVGAQEFKVEIAAEQAAGQLSSDEAAFLNPVLDGVAQAADGVLASSVDWRKLNKADKLEIAHLAVTQIGDAVERLSQKSIGLKSAQAKATFERYLRDARLAVATLRVIEAGLSQPPNTSPSSTPTPAP
ncbi:MAG TPA: hypothetical protein VHU19_14315 [Pyrinomonadaceae bacterium]|jgi:hypothetical protein|nr:hypothetical protein [Pyrinomonadaceae bacterium]